jgi:hypothetical protein
MEDLKLMLSVFVVVVVVLEAEPVLGAGAVAAGGVASGVAGCGDWARAPVASRAAVAALRDNVLNIIGSPC